MINNVTLIGRLTRDAELRYTPNYANPMDIDESDLPF